MRRGFGALERTIKTSEIGLAVQDSASCGSNPPHRDDIDAGLDAFLVVERRGWKREPRHGRGALLGVLSPHAIHLHPGPQ